MYKNVGIVNGKTVEVTVDNMSDLKKAVKENILKIKVVGSVAKKIKPLTKAKVKKENLRYGMTQNNFVGCITGVEPLILAMIIMAIGMTTIVALFLHYNVKVS